MTVVVEMTERCVYENARVALDQKEYQSRYDRLVDRFQKLQEEHDSVTAWITGNMARKKTVEQFIGTFARQPEAKEKGYKAGDFSYNTGRLRCPVCDGTGEIDLDVIRSADYVINMGPGGGEAGGRIV